MLPGPAVVIKPTQGMPVIWAPQQASRFSSGQHTTTWALTLFSHRKRPGSIISLELLCFSGPGKKIKHLSVDSLLKWLRNSCFHFMINVNDPVKWIFHFGCLLRKALIYLAPGFTHDLLDLTHSYHQRVIFQAVFLGDICQGSKPRWQKSQPFCAYQWYVVPYCTYSIHIHKYIIYIYYILLHIISYYIILYIIIFYYILFYFIISYYILLYPIISYYILYPIISYYILLYFIISYSILLYPIISYYILLYRIISYYILLSLITYYILLYHIIYYYILLCPILFYYILLYHIIFYYIVLYPTISYYILLHIISY